MIERTFKFRLWPNKTQLKYLEELENKARDIYNELVMTNIFDEKYYDDTTALEMYDRFRIAKKNHRDKRCNNDYRIFQPPQIKSYDKVDGISVFIKPSINGNRILFDDQNIKVKIHRELPEFKKCCIKRYYNDWYIYFYCELNNIKNNLNVIGIDMGSVNLCTAFDGTASVIYKSRKNKNNPQKREQSQKAYIQWICSHFSGCIVKVEKLERFLNNNHQRHSNWDLLRKCIKSVAYKMVGIDPANTSTKCNKCDYVDRDNRKTQDSFLCIKCGHKDNADCNAARNIYKI